MAMVFILQTVLASFSCEVCNIEYFFFYDYYKKIRVLLEMFILKWIKSKQIILSEFKTSRRTMKPSNRAFLTLLRHFGLLWGSSIPLQIHYYERIHLTVEDVVLEHSDRHWFQH